MKALATSPAENLLAISSQRKERRSQNPGMTMAEWQAHGRKWTVKIEEQR